MRITAFIALYVLTTTVLCGQEIQHSISATGGISQLINKDLYRSTFKYSGLNPTMGVFYQRSAPTGIHEGFVELSMGKLKTSFSTPAPFSLLHVNYGYLRKIYDHKKIKIHLGPSAQGMSWKINYFPDMQVPYYAKVQSYMVAISAGLQAQVDYQLSARSRLRLFLAAPLCSYTDRPGFLDGSTRQIHFEFLKLWNPQARLTYEYQVSDRFSILLNYHNSYLQYQKPKDIRMLENGFSIGFKINFRNKYKNDVDKTKQ